MENDLKTDKKLLRWRLQSPLQPMRMCRRVAMAITTTTKNTQNYTSGKNSIKNKKSLQTIKIHTSKVTSIDAELKTE